MDRNYKSIPYLIISTDVNCSKFIEHKKAFDKSKTILLI